MKQSNKNAVPAPLIFNIMTSQLAANSLWGIVVERSGAGDWGEIVAVGGNGGDAANLRTIRHWRGSLIREVVDLRKWRNLYMNILTNREQ